MDLNHLKPEIQEFVAKASAVDRMRFAQEVHWIKYPRAKEVHELLEDHLNYPECARMPHIVLVGPTNNGKTTILEQFMKLHPIDARLDQDTCFMPVILVLMPSRADERSLYDRILAAFATPILSSSKTLDKQRQVIAMLRACNTRMLIVDEAQDALTGNDTQIRALMQGIKLIGNDARISIVLAGTEKVRNVIVLDDSLANRFKPVLLPRWDNVENFSRLLASFEQWLPLREPSLIDVEPFSAKLFEMSEGLVGEVATILALCVQLALRANQEKLDVTMLDSIDYLRPSARRKFHANKKDF